jgi:cytochrome b
MVAISFITGNVGGNTMTWHLRSGYAILGLLFFRLAWGFVGSRTSRFSDFVQGPSAVLRYAATLLRPDSPRFLGHNPMGGWSVMAMLLALLVQAGSGLFADDQIMTAGPLAGWVGGAVSEALTRLHRFNRWTLAGLVGLHLGAILFYLLVKGENLIKPMVTGRKPWTGGGGVIFYSSWRAVLAALAAALVVWFIVR